MQAGWLSGRLVAKSCLVKTKTKNVNNMDSRKSSLCVVSVLAQEYYEPLVPITSKTGYADGLTPRHRDRI